MAEQVMRPAAAQSARPAAAQTARPATKRAQRKASIEGLHAAALSLFVSQGYQHTSVERVAARAGLTKGSVYFYFGTKAALLLALLDQVEEIVVAAAAARVDAAGPSAPDKLVAFLHGQAVLGVERWEYVLLLILMSLEFHGQDGPVGDRIAAIYGRLYTAVEGIIASGKQAGEFRDDVPTREQAALVMAAHDGTFLEWHRRGAVLDGAALVRALRTAMLAGLAAK